VSMTAPGGGSVAAMPNPVPRLADAREQQRAHPRTYRVPPESEVLALGPGSVAKLCFLFAAPALDGCDGERMWVRVTHSDGGKFRGVLDNEPSRPELDGLLLGAEVEFESRHVLAV